METKKVFSKNLKKYRKLAGLTKKDLAKLLNVHWNTVNRWENGEIFPRTELLNEIAEILNIEVSQLFEPPTPEPFPGYNEIIELPVRERYEAIWRLVGRKYGIEVLHALGDPIFKDKVPLLETQEEIVDTYNKVEEIVKHLYERIQKELKEKALETLKKE